MTRLTSPPREVASDLSLLEPLRVRTYDGRLRPARVAPYLVEGQVVSWHYVDLELPHRRGGTSRWRSRRR